MEHAYIGRTSSGCILDAVLDIPGCAEVTTAVKAMQAQGLLVELLPLSEANREVQNCFSACRNVVDLPPEKGCPLAVEMAMEKRIII